MREDDAAMDFMIEVVRPERMTAEWLTAVIRGAGHDVEVENFSAKAVGTGQLADTIRYTLYYKGDRRCGAPSTVIGKYSSSDSTAFKSGTDFGLYQAEALFYKNLAPIARVRTPEVFAAEIDPAGNFVLILEDLAPAVAGDQMRGCTLQEARDAVKEMALLHAAFWERTDELAGSWVATAAGAQLFYSTELIENCWEQLQRQSQHVLDSEVFAVCDRFVRNHAYWNRPRSGPRHFSHNDFRLDNLMFGGSDGRVAVVDWQTSGIVGAGLDLSFFVCGAFSRSARLEHESTLRDLYLRCLSELGVANYGRDQLHVDYAHYSFQMMSVGLVAMQAVERTERGDALFLQMITSSAHQAIDNDALALLPG